MSDKTKSAIISLVAETHVHAGIGQSTGALDLPVARERTTDFPFIPGSGVKGAFKVWAKEKAGLGSEARGLFGPDNDDNGTCIFAGSLLCSDARLLLLPVRCLSEAYKWVTCPTILNRFERDCKRAGQECLDLSSVAVNPTQYLGKGSDNVALGLEEREFEFVNNVPVGVVETIKRFIEMSLKDFVDERLVILSDNDFNWFAKYALPIMTRNALDQDKIVKPGALWHEESLAPDTIMYMLLSERQMKDMSAVDTMVSAIDRAPYIQMGGNETIGQGWFKMAIYPQASGDEGGNNG